MRRSIVHEGAKNLSYEIREIVGVAHAIRDLGQEVIWENIGDPIQKGEQLAPWIQEILHGLLDEPRSYAYCDTAGDPETRAFLADTINQRKGGVQVSADDLLFFNGIGDAVARVYGFLKREARILGPSPAYSTHSSAEAAHSGYDHLTYQLTPYNGWMPDIEDIRNKVKYNDAIAGILLLSPDNPTGAVYPRSLLEQIVEIARQHDLFIIADEIYTHIVFPGYPVLNMSQWIEDVPGMAMRGISKEYPWPGARCGWLEFFNKDKDEDFATYTESLLAAKRLEVCSTTLPQLSIPRVHGDARFPGHCKTRARIFNDRANEVVDAFHGCDAVIANKPGGAFYFTIMFKEGVLNGRQTLPIANAAIRKRVEALVENTTHDRRFVYYLMGATGIVVVPLTSFQCDYPGFRLTLLEDDDEKRAWIFRTLRDAIDQYTAN